MLCVGITSHILAKFFAEEASTHRHKRWCIK